MMTEREEGWVPQQEPDHVPWRPVALTLMVFLGVMGASLLWVTCFTAAPPQVPTVPAGASQARGAVYGEVSPARQLAEAQRRTLETYGWVDRDSGIVRIPIERAMQIVAADPDRDDDDAENR